MNVAQHVERGRDRHPDRIALRFEGAAFSYADLDARASRLGRLLAGLGVGRGDRVGLYLPNCPEFVLGYLATQKLGAIAVSLNASWKREELVLAAADAGTVVVLTTGDREGNVPRDRLPALRSVVLVESLDTTAGGSPADLPSPDVDAATPAAIVYSSGTTGEPKGCTLSHGNVVSNIQAKVEYLGIEPGDRLLLFVPLFHCFGQNAVLNAAFEAGAEVVLERRFSVDRVLRMGQAEAPTMFFGSPTAFARVIDRAQARDLVSVRYYFSAAAPLPPELAVRWQERFGRPIHEGYGLTETSPFASYNHRTRHRVGSVGTPIRDVEIDVVDPDTGAPLGTDVIGELVIRGPNVMLGYWDRPDDTARVMRGGWFHTGDLGRRDRDGYLFLVDRLKDQINVGGLKVSPIEVERVLDSHPAVSAAAVLGAADPLMGERVAACVVLHAGRSATASELIAYCRDRLADYKAPASVRFMSALPVSPTGKVLKRVLRGESAG